ncbi:hypothetical protein C8R41DRAFT_902689 [Lentinula lateritia]|uniref:Uncharacterized protein n=1 Tax=Lentinula lateritia TaxID=40482 RepID=A0ABQ8VGA6_9AGAR|nr:hypothetical protein C8R41DRAFT_902689 [Lentinula lateritia]
MIKIPDLHSSPGHKNIIPSRRVSEGVNLYAHVGEELIEQLTGSFIPGATTTSERCKCSSTEPEFKWVGSVAHTSGSTGYHESPELQKHEGLGEKLMNVFDSRPGSKPFQTEHTQPPLPQSKDLGLPDGVGDIFEGKIIRKRRREEENSGRQRLELEAEEAKHTHLPLDIFEKLGFGNPLYHSTPPSKKGRYSSQFNGGITDKIQNDLDKGQLTLNIIDSIPLPSLTTSSRLSYYTAIDFVQHHILRQGAQSHELILEQLKDEQIARTIRALYQNLTGREFPLKEGALALNDIL